MNESICIFGLNKIKLNFKIFDTIDSFMFSTNLMNESIYKLIHILWYNFYKTCFEKEMFLQLFKRLNQQYELKILPTI